MPNYAHDTTHGGVLITIPLLLLSVNIDAFSVGFAYGTRGVKLPIRTQLLISLIAATAFLAAGQVGQLLHGIIGTAAVVISSVLLYAIALYTILTCNQSDGVLCDYDDSKSIDLREGLFLGMALSLDNVGVNLCYALTGGATLGIAALVALSQLLLLQVGLRAPRLLARRSLKSAYIKLSSAILLMILATIRLFA